MKREGWAAVVGQTFKTRNGGSARIREYRVWVDGEKVDALIEAALEVEGLDKTMTVGAYRENGSFAYMLRGRSNEAARPDTQASPGNSPHPLDLVEWDRPRVR